MKALNNAAGAVMDKLTEGLNAGSIYRKINTRDGAFMAVNINFLFHRPEGSVFSIAHNYEQAGDLMADPDMTFLKSLDLGKWYPLTYQNDGVGLYQEAVIFGLEQKITGHRPRLQRQLVSFANIWMKNIKNQQPDYFKSGAQAELALAK